MGIRRQQLIGMLQLGVLKTTGPERLRLFQMRQQERKAVQS